jgi:hypothetical protein
VPNIIYSSIAKGEVISLSDLKPPSLVIDKRMNMQIVGFQVALLL